MALRIKTTLVLVFFLLLTIPLLSGRVPEGFKIKSNNPINSLHQEDGRRMMINWRKLLIMPDGVLDYDDAEPNPRHDPRKKRANP